MADKIYVTQAQLDAIVAGLSKLKKKEDTRFALKAAVIRISPTITDALGKGYGYADIAEILLRDHGLEIKPSTLSSYHRGAGTLPSKSNRRNAASDASGTDTTPELTPSTVSPLVPDQGSADHVDDKFIKDPVL